MFPGLMIPLKKIPNTHDGIPQCRGHRAEFNKKKVAAMMSINSIDET